MKIRNVQALKQHIDHRVFELAQELFGLSDGNNPNDPAHKQPCPVPDCPSDDDGFRYYPEWRTFHCRQCGLSGDIIRLTERVCNVSFLEAFDIVAEAAGYIDVATPETKTTKPTGKKSKRFRQGTAKRTEYFYRDENGNPFHKVVRTDGIDEATGEPDKTFVQKKFHNGQWEYGAPDKTVPYHLPEVLKVGTIAIAEGEKTADCLNRTLQAAGITDVIATSSPMGAPSGKQWRKFVQRYPDIVNKRIVIIPDNDKPGMGYARTVAGAILGANPSADVKIVELNDRPLPDGGDFVDWRASFFDDGKDESVAIEKLFELCKHAEPITPHTIITWEQSESVKQHKPGKPSKNRARPILIRVSEVVEKAIAWLWENKIPLGMLSLIGGLAGVGKSFLTVFMTAIITNGWQWPDGSVCEKGSVLFFYGEEGIADTYKKRFRANGADQSKVVFLNGVELIGKDDERSESDVTLAMVDVIETAIHDTAEKTGLPVKMVVIDPISNYWGDKKENSNAEVRSVLKPLQHLAEKTGVAFVLIQHIGKGDKEHAQQRILGSTGIVAACRSVWGVWVDPDDKDKRIFAPVKVNCGYNHTAVSYTITPPDGTVEIIETGIQKTGDDIVREQKQANCPKRGRPANERLACEVKIMEILKDGDRRASEMWELLVAEGFTKSTIREAKNALMVESIGKGKKSQWHLSPDFEVGNVD